MVGCLLWMVLEGGLLALVGFLLMCWRLVLGAVEGRGGEGYTSHILGDWAGSEDFASGASSGVLAANLDVWTDGSAGA